MPCFILLLIVLAVFGGVSFTLKTVAVLFVAAALFVVGTFGLAFFFITSQFRASVRARRVFPSRIR